MNHIDPSTRLFPLYDEKVLRGQANKIAWCPTTDLAVIAFQDHVALYRGGVTKIWSMAIPEYTTITSLVWKPNGKEFAMGCGDGTVYKVAVSWAEPRSVVCWPPTKNAQAAAITCLLWVPYTREKTVNANNTFDPLTGRLVSAIPALSMVPPDEPAPLLPRRTKKTPLPHEPTNDGEEQTLLLIGDANGHLYLSLNGIYHIGTVPLLQRFVASMCWETWTRFRCW
ncbi:uncharacterized protein BYT42DRAFT_123220 [Radiomyces spectabilis]|uniref:uncharacterized protein n=1 Tax=Radiomyces spectabilis TaxID=64574 RepID=UPI002220A2A7|nr:uncharacterized protein BYT42DRAFT_123220 [Radiomyces spectabilis]KAI8368229.1 hypothetical protein BYT42DRAFT_123220 [Radiomyces spectabilis]